MTKSRALLGLFVSMLCVGGAYAAAFLPGGAPAWGNWLMALGNAGVMVFTLVLGAARKNRVAHPALKFVFAYTFLALFAGFGAALRAPTPSPDARLILGLPAGAAIVLYIVGLSPM